MGRPKKAGPTKVSISATVPPALKHWVETLQARSPVGLTRSEAIMHALDCGRRYVRYLELEGRITAVANHLNMPQGEVVHRALVLGLAALETGGDGGGQLQLFKRPRD